MRKFLLVSIVVWIAGCASSNSHVQPIGAMRNIDIVENSVKSQRENNLLIAQAILYNSSNSTVNAYYRCEFTNANGMLIIHDQIWQSVTLYPQGNQAIECSATDPAATDFKFQFSKDAQNVTALTY